jgi:periplasmic copper chaperone A
MYKKILLAMYLCSFHLIAGDILVEDAYVRAVPPSLQNSASFMNIINNSNKVIYLEKAESSLAKKLEFHEHIMNNNMMKMQELAQIKIPANGSVKLAPGGYHIMLLGLNQPIKNGDIVQSIKLYFSNEEVVELNDIPILSVMNGMKMNKTPMKKMEN